MEMRKRHLLRIDSAEKGKSQFDAQFERDTLEYMQIDKQIEYAKKMMANFGTTVPVWEWVISVKGLKAGGLAAQLLAQIDDIGKSPTVASLWRFAGLAVINGEAEKNKKGKTSTFNRKLKGICYNIADQFIRQQTPGYVDIYYEHKEYQRREHPMAICEDCQRPAEKYQKKVKGELVDAWRCPVRNKDHKIKYSDAHIHNRAWRKMVKAFLRDLWLEWRKVEGLPVSEEYAKR